MSKQRKSKLADHAEQLDEWFGQEEVTLAEARARLGKAGCSVSLARLSEWRRARQWELLRQQLLDQIAAGARHCHEVESEFGKNPPPELETLIKLHRVIVLQLSAQAKSDPEAVRLVSALMKPVMDWARLQEDRRKQEWAEQKYREQVAAQKAEVERELGVAKTTGGLSLETIEKIERELKLM